MKALLLHPGGEFRFGDIDDVEPVAGFVTIEPELVGICGSDVHIARGRHPRVQLPVALGHEIVGRALDGAHAGRRVAVDPVEGCGACDRCREGREQLCAQLGILGVDRHGGLAARVAVRAHAVHPVPDDMPVAVAGLTEALAVAVHAVERAGVRDGDLAVVIGGGPIGFMIAICARDAGAARVIVVEPAAERRSMSAQLGFEVLDSTEPLARLRGAIGGIGADVVFDAAAASGIPPILTSLVRSGGTVLVAGVYHEHGAVDLPDLVYREISVIGTRACTQGDMRGAIDLLVRRPAEFEVLAGDVVGPERMGDAVARLGRGETMKVLVDCEPFRR